MRRTIVLFACVALAACGNPEVPTPADPGGGGGGGGGGGDPTPPNGSFATAATIALDTQVTETRTSAFGDDYFSFVVPAGGRTVRIQTFDSSGTACESPGTESPSTALPKPRSASPGGPTPARMTPGTSRPAPTT